VDTVEENLSAGFRRGRSPDAQNPVCREIPGRDGEAAFSLQSAVLPEGHNPFVLVNHSPTICLNPPFLIPGG
jgi:hypothetical protein